MLSPVMPWRSFQGTSSVAFIVICVNLQWFALQWFHFCRGNDRWVLNNTIISVTWEMRALWVIGVSNAGRHDPW
jgi:hypothetical protein